jgi:hypothetical protein
LGMALTCSRLQQSKGKKENEQTSPEGVC